MSLKKRTEKLTEELEERAYEEELNAVERSPEPVPNEDLQQTVDRLEQECAEWKDKYLRSMAEFENYRRRSNQEKTDWIKLATQKLALQVCDVADNFERALQHSAGLDKEDGFVKGVLMIEQQLRSLLDKEGVRKIEALGEEFDPNLHEALAHIQSGYEENKVAAVIQNGYLMHDKLLRPARVAVSSGKVETPEPDQPEADSGGNGSGTIEIEIQ